MVNIEEITEYFNELFRLWGQKELVEKQNLLNIFTIGSFGTACRGRFDSLDKMVTWYNNRPHGSLNLRRAETPNDAFIRKMHPEVWLGFAFKMFGW